jgi:hypothetical protein
MPTLRALALPWGHPLSKFLILPTTLFTFKALPPSIILTHIPISPNILLAIGVPPAPSDPIMANFTVLMPGAKVLSYISVNSRKKVDRSSDRSLGSP